jgi:hypothetical protein
MEGIITLVVVIIVFNVINALIKGLRGDRSVEKRTIPAEFEEEEETLVSPPKKERIDPFFGLDILEEKAEPVPAHEPVSDPVYEPVTSYQSDSPPEVYEQVQREGSKRAAKRLPPRPSTAASPGSVSMHLERIFSQKEPLVAAFIFHEIFGPSTAQRRKR